MSLGLRCIGIKTERYIYLSKWPSSAYIAPGRVDQFHSSGCWHQKLPCKTIFYLFERRGRSSANSLKEEKERRDIVTWKQHGKTLLLQTCNCDQNVTMSITEQESTIAFRRALCLASKSSLLQYIEHILNREMFVITDQNSQPNSTHSRGTISSAITTILAQATVTCSYLSPNHWMKESIHHITLFLQ